MSDAIDESTEDAVAVGVSETSGHHLPATRESGAWTDARGTVLVAGTAASELGHPEAGSHQGLDRYHQSHIGTWVEQGMYHTSMYLRTPLTTLCSDRG